MLSDDHLRHGGREAGRTCAATIRGGAPESAVARALSKGINDPGTAITCIDRLALLLQQGERVGEQVFREAHLS